MKSKLLLLSLMFLSACKPQMDDLKQFMVEVESTPPMAIEPYPTFETKPAFKYAVENLRSPFQRAKNAQQKVAQKTIANCLQPDFEKGKMPLEQFGIDALEIQGFFTTQGSTWGIIKANDGLLYKVTTGDRLGLFFGEITHMIDNTIYFTELLPDGTGCWKKKESKLSLTKDTGENNNV